MSTTRRAALATLAGLGAGLGLASAASAVPSCVDKIPVLHAKRRRAISLVDNGLCETQDKVDELMDVMQACDVEATSTSATTPAGAIASIKWVRDELLQFGFDEDDLEGNGSRLVLALLEGALGVLQGMEGAA